MTEQTVTVNFEYLIISIEETIEKEYVNRGKINRVEVII
jgi:hypothetical protein